MKKETMAAIVFGILMGGVLAVTLITKNKQTQLEKSKTIAPTEKPIPSPGQSDLKFQPLEIVAPKDGIMVDKSETTISAKGTKDSLVVIQSPIKDLVFINEKVQFSVNFPLALGENVITIVIYPKDSKFRSQEKRLRVYYLKEQL
jgi:Na+/glutamate symporter